VSGRRHGLNPAKLKADIAAMEREVPSESPRPRVDVRRGRVVALLALLTAVLLLASFAPFNQWYLAYVALVPWVLAVVGPQRQRTALLWAYLAGVAFWAAGLYWLTWITLIGFVPLVLYLALYWLAAAWVLRRAFQRGWPMWIVLPVVWVALEYLRASQLALSGFPWFSLAHSQYANTRLIQIADVTGQYGVSFLVAMVNGAVADALAGPLLKVGAGGRRRRLLVAGAVCLASAGGLWLYGAARLAQKTTRPGPKVALVQLAFPISLFHENAPPEEVFGKHLDNSRPLVGAGCDLVVWPESMLGYLDLDPSVWFARRPDEIDPATGQPTWTSEQREIIREYRASLRALQALLGDLGCPLLAGGGTVDAVSGLTTNSALLFDRDRSGRIRLSRKYHKRHLVPFSESVPFGQSWPWLHGLLRRVVPESMPQLQPGRRAVRFEIPPPGRDEPRKKPFQIAVPICYEGVFARVCRAMVVEKGRKQVDVLVNLSNDGWFVWATSRWTHAGTELDQHLAQYAFRAVESRVPVLRAVNTGISAHVDSNGRLVATVEHAGRRRMVGGNLVAQTLVDERVSLYSLAGDLFAQAVSVLAGAAAIVLWCRRPRKQ